MVYSLQGRSQDFSEGVRIYAVAHLPGLKEAARPEGAAI